MVKPIPLLSDELYSLVVGRTRLDAPTGCWLWTSTLDSSGYAYHLCRARACINPWHLDPVTQQVNIQRGDTGRAKSTRTHCKNGHLFTDNTTRFVRAGKYTVRRCRPCQQAWGRADYAKKVTA